MKSEPVQSLPRRSFLFLLGGVVLVTCGATLLFYAWVVRFTAIEFLEKGTVAEATIRNIEHRGAKHGGRRIEVGFWEKRDGMLLGELRFAELTDLVPLRHAGEREGDEIAIRWFKEDGRLRLAPERSLHAETRPPEMQFAFGIVVTATGGILLGFYTMREARRRERPVEMR